MNLIDASLAHRLIVEQFAQWQDLSIQPILPGGWDNRTFRLGNDKTIRLPSGAEYADQVSKEQCWLPKLAASLPLPIPEPLAMGKPSTEYPWPWSVYGWLEGEAAASARITDLKVFASDLAHFLIAFQHLDTSGGPLAGPHNFYRGGSLANYDKQTRQAVVSLKGKVDANAAILIWESALQTAWEQPPVWVHGDISPGNLLVQNGSLAAVIDFGGLAIGDPACDLAIAWTFFDADSRDVFQQELKLDENTWLRGKAWGLWKALIVAAGMTDTNIVEKTRAWITLETILHKT